MGVASTLLFTSNGCGSGYRTLKANSPVSHVVIIFQENRTPDNLFQDSVLISRGADIAQSGVDSHGHIIALSPVPLANKYDLSHAHSAFVDMYDDGKMDGADRIPITCIDGLKLCSPIPNPQFGYVPPAEVMPYFSLAEQYTFGDRMFQTNEGPSYPAHQFIIAGTSAPDTRSTLFVGENPATVNDTGCAAPPSQRVAMIDQNGTEDIYMFPCFEHPTLIDSLDNRGGTWRYYSPVPGGIWTAPNSIRHLCEPQVKADHYFTCDTLEWNRNVVLSATQVLTDIGNGDLANVTWVIPSGLSSDHAAANDGSGPSWVAQVVNAIGNSRFWDSTAVFITWDDWGGWYDHVPPPKVLKDCSDWGCGYVYGFRVPLIVVSPYAKPAYISHVQHDFGSILRYIEENFGLEPLGYADAYADNLSDCFNYQQPPLPFRTIAAPLDAAHFLNDPRPPTPPDND